MKRTAVTSSNIASIGHDPNTDTLEVEFTNGSIYQYDGVIVEVYEALMKAERTETESVGKTLNGLVRGRFPYRQVQGPRERAKSV